MLGDPLSGLPAQASQLTVDLSIKLLARDPRRNRRLEGSLLPLALSGTRRATIPGGAVVVAATRTGTAAHVPAAARAARRVAVIAPALEATARTRCTPATVFSPCALVAARPVVTGWSVVPSGRAVAAAFTGPGMVTDRAHAIVSGCARAAALVLVVPSAVASWNVPGTAGASSVFGRAATGPLAITAVVAVYAVPILLTVVSHVARPSSLWVHLVEQP